MSDVLGRAIFARLSGDAPLVALLDTYRSAPAIFGSPDVPKDAALAAGWVTCGQQLGGEPFDTKTSTGGRVTRDLGCYCAREGNVSDKVHTIAARVRSLLHRHRLTVTGQHTVIAEAAFPVSAPTDATLYGLIVPVRWTLVDA